MIAKSLVTLVLVAGLGLIPTGARADAPAPQKSAAKVTRAEAEKIALARVPGGHIKEGELETERGKLVWSFDITTATSANVTEVQVDAINASIVSVVTETPKDQAREAAQDAKKKESRKN